MAIRGCTFSIIFILLVPFPFCNAGELNFNVCEQVSARQLAALYRTKLFSSEQENGCRWSNEPRGMTYFQIGIIEGQKNLRAYFQKAIPSDFTLMKINDLGDRGLMTTAEGYLAVIVVREGEWVLVSTVNYLFIKHRSERHKILWDIYRGILKKLQ